MTEAIVAARNVSRVFAAGRLTALAGVSVEVGRGDYVAVTGPSGSGKSTLLHLLCGIDSPTRGEVLFDGAGPHSPARWRQLRAKRIGLVFQSFNLLAALTARENLEAAMFGVRAGAGQRKKRAEELLDRVGLRRRERHRPGELSGGECQRLAIARAMANEPELLLADEPTGNLDSCTSREILGLLEELRDEGGATLVIVTHDGQIAERARRVLHLLDGQVHSDARRGN